MAQETDNKYLHAIKEVNYKDLEADLREATGIKDGDDSKLKVAYNAASRYANGILQGGQVNPQKLIAILATSLFEMTVLRFNRLEQEGIKQVSQDGESITWSDNMYSPWDNKLKAALIDENASGWIVRTYTTTEYDGGNTATYETYHPFFGSNMWFWQNDGEPYRVLERGL